MEIVILKGGYVYMKQETRNEQLANDIIKFLKKNDLDTDVTLMYNGKRVFADTGDVEDIVSAGDYVEYFNDDTITMTFEGNLYELLNGYWDNEFNDTYQKMYDDFGKIFEKYGLYYELGYAWSLAAYEM